METKNVLIFPCGSEIGLEINNALKYSKNINIYGGSTVSDHGRFVYSNYVSIPSINDDDFISSLNEVIKKFSIDYIFPAHDSVVLLMSLQAKKINAQIITSDSKTTDICRSKGKTYDFFKEEDFIPFVYKNVDEVNDFPVFLKPDVGQGSKGIALAGNQNQLNYIYTNNDNMLILEYLPGKEFTIDCFTDRLGELRFVGMRERRRIKSGISVNSVNLLVDTRVRDIAEKINNKLNFRGVWFFQLKEDNQGSLKLLEISPRIAGTMGLYRNKGVNLPLLSLFDRMNLDIDIVENGYNIEIDRAFINRFSMDFEYQRVYLDFDDSITLNGKVNPYVMMYIYQCNAKGIEVILITKHEKDINDTLNELKIDKQLFKNIIHLTKESQKHLYIDKDIKSIFIDDSFSERKEVYREHNIPVFDIDAIESLIDWRV
ncbi:ATP-grasp domain-containing protein [Cytobacillus sp. FSL K6-0129]|uniref:ATP-grasp domain-containing protein n=1 Tax=Cytobacillus sp. FSL K6-0129 TaxID=2921421 RepID=UPI0030FCE247